MTSAATGQAAAQAGSTQCMHWRFTNVDLTPPSAVARSVKRTRVKVLASRWVGFVPVPENPVCAGASSFQLLHATWQARHPTQRVVSMSMAFVMSSASQRAATTGATFWTFTRHALVSCVPAPGSTASMVRTFALGPRDSPWKPQL